MFALSKEVPGLTFRKAEVFQEFQFQSLFAKDFKTGKWLSMVYTVARLKSNQGLVAKFLLTLNKCFDILHFEI